MLNLSTGMNVSTINSLESWADPEGDWGGTGGPDPPEKSPKYRVS